MVLPSSQDEALARYSVSKDVPGSVLIPPHSPEQNSTKSPGEQGGCGSSCQETRHRQGWGQVSRVGQAAADQLQSRNRPGRWGGGPDHTRAFLSLTVLAFKGTSRNGATGGWGKLQTVDSQGLRGWLQGSMAEQ